MLPFSGQRAIPLAFSRVDTQRDCKLVAKRARTAVRFAFAVGKRAAEVCRQVAERRRQVSVGREQKRGSVRWATAGGKSVGLF